MCRVLLSSTLSFKPARDSDTILIFSEGEVELDIFKEKLLKINKLIFFIKQTKVKVTLKKSN